MFFVVPGQPRHLAPSFGRERGETVRVRQQADAEAAKGLPRTGLNGDSDRT